MKKVKDLAVSLENFAKEIQQLLNNTSEPTQKDFLFDIHQQMTEVQEKFQQYQEQVELLEKGYPIPKRPSIEEQITRNLWEAIDFGKILSIYDELFVTSFSKKDDGIFPTLQDWKKFVDNVDSLGTYFLSEYLSDNRSVFDEKQKIRLVLPEPIRIITGFKMVKGHKEYIVSYATEFIIALNYEWYYNTNAQMADTLEVTGKIWEIKK
jgi:hypothetical protein